MLEREGVWNYVVSGSLIITFPGGSGFAPYTFRTTDLHRGTAIDCSYHWVVAPPFQVIDIAIQTCQYPYPFMHLLPKIVWETNGELAVAEGFRALCDIPLVSRNRSLGVLCDGRSVGSLFPDVPQPICGRFSRSDRHAAGYATEVRADARDGCRTFAGAVHGVSIARFFGGPNLRQESPSAAVVGCPPTTSTRSDRRSCGRFRPTRGRWAMPTTPAVI